MVSKEYHSYLLQLWRAEDGDGCWRARLEDVESGERQGFASLEKLVEFLHGLYVEKPGAGWIKEQGDE